MVLRLLEWDFLVVVVDSSGLLALTVVVQLVTASMVVGPDVEQQRRLLSVEWM